MHGVLRCMLQNLNAYCISRHPVACLKARKMDDNERAVKKIAKRHLRYQYCPWSPWPGVMAVLTGCGIKGCPIKAPGVAVVEAIEGHQGFCVSFVPLSAAAFQMLGRGSALRLGRPAADLPSATAKQRVTDRFAPFSRRVCRRFCLLTQHAVNQCRQQGN